MSEVVFEATSRTDTGKGASRRLRRLENRFPAIVYGGKKDSINIELAQNKVLKAFENEDIFSSVFDITVDGKKEHVIIKDLQRHPYKSIILHMDLQRVNPKDVLVKMVPLRFLNEKKCKGVKTGGGIITRNLTQVEVTCLARNLPPFIEVDVAKLTLDDIVHLSQIKMPKAVSLTADLSDSAHDHPVVSVHLPRGGFDEEEEEVEEEEEEAPAADDETDTKVEE